MPGRDGRLSIAPLATARLMVAGLAIAGLATIARAQAPAASAPAATPQATTRMSLVKIDAPPLREDERPSPYGNFGPLLSQLLTPEGPVHIDYVIAGDQTRADVRGRLPTLPKGSGVIHRPGDGTT